MPRFALILFCLAASIAWADTPQKSLTGTVVDVRGKPVAGAILCGQWGPAKLGAVPRCLGQETSTDASGHFAAPPPPWMGFFGLLVFNAAHTSGALVDAEHVDLSRPLRIELQALQPVHYRILSSLPVAASAYHAHLYVFTNSVVGFVLGADGVVFLPPGKYMLSASVEDSNDASRNFEVKDHPLRLEPLRLVPSIMAQHYGHKAPATSALVDMDHKPATIPPLRGHWTLLYFWENGCAPCIQTGLPSLIEFAKSGQAKSANLQIVAINSNLADASSNWETFHSYTAKLEATLWHAVPSFPMLYDESDRTSKDWGIRMFPTYGLIDPSGKLVRTEDFEAVKAKLGLGKTGETMQTAH